MPARIKKRGKCFSVVTPKGTRAKCTSKKKAEAQRRLLNAIDHGFVPTRKR